MKRYHTNISRIFAGMIAVILLLGLMPSMTVSTSAGDDQGSKTVRVAAEESGLFFNSDKDGKPVSGYAYEYIETIAAYAGWDVEYVMRPTFAECYQMLLDGEADLFYDVSYSPERAQQVLFPNTLMGTKEYYLYCLTGNSAIHAMDYASYDGKNVGVTAGTLQADRLKTWADNKGIFFNIVELESVAEKEAALGSGSIDFALENGMLANSAFSALDRIAGDDYYLAVNSERQDLLDDINAACAKLLSIDRNYLRHLDEKYYSGLLVSRSLTADEALWVSGHDTLTVGYMDDYLPFSDLDRNGEVSGIVKDIVPLMLENIGLSDRLSVRYVPFEDNGEMYDSLNRGETDCIFPVCGSMNFALGKSALFSSDVIGTGIDLVFKDTFSAQTTSVIAVNSRNQLQDYYTKLFYPDAAIVYCDSIEACLDAVASGKAETTILNGMRTIELLRRGHYSDMLTLRLPENAELSFAVKGDNSALLAIIDRAIANTDTSAALTFSYNYLYGDSVESQIEFFKAHPEYLIGLITLLFACAFAFLIFKKRQDKRHAERKRKEQIARMAGGVSMYIVNPLTERFTIISQNEHLAANYPSEEDFTTSITRYIESDVYPADRITAKKAINIKKMSAYLRTEGEYFFKYRDISGGVPRWYEMRAVRLSDTEILFGFSDKDDEISEQLMFDRMRDNYFCLYYADVESDLAKIVINRSAGDIAGTVGKTVRFSRLIQGMRLTAEGEEAEALDRIASPDAIRKLYETDDTVYTVYKSKIFGQEKWITLTGFVLARDNRGMPALMGIGFGMLDDEACEKEEAKLQLKESMEVVGGLAEEYTVLYHVNLDTGHYVPYQIKGRADNIRPLYEKCTRFAELAEAFADSELVRPEDREALHDFYPSDEAVRTALKGKKLLSMLFKRSYGGEYLWTEMTIIKCEPAEETAHNILVGFIEKDQEIKREAEKIKAAQEAEGLIENTASKYNLAYVVNISDDSFRLLKADADIVGANEQFQNFTEAKEFFISGPLHPADRDRMRREMDYAYISENLAKINSYSVEYRALINGRTIWHEMVITAIDRDTIAVGFGVRGTELTRKHLEEKRFEELFALFEVDLDTEMLKVVKNEQHYQEVPVGETVPYKAFILDFTRLLDDEPKAFFLQISDLDYVRRDLAFDDKRSYTYKSRHIRADQWIEVTTYVILRHEDGTPSMFTIGFSYVDALATSRQEVQAQLRAAYDQVKEVNLRNELLYEISHAAKWSYQISAAGEVISAFYDSNAYKQMDFAITEDPIGWIEEIHPDERERVRAEFMAVVADPEGRTPFDSSFRICDRDGAYHWIKSAGRVMRHEDGTGELFGLSINITEQIEKEREQQEMLEEARNAAEAANRSKTSFLFSMSHDIRTPMNAITGFTNMAKKHIDDREKVKDYLNKIDVSGKQLLTLINQVLEMARIESGKVEVEEKPVDIREEFESLATVLEEQAHINGLNFTSEYDCPYHGHVLADIARLSSIALNIAGNAIKYTPRGGHIDFVLRELPTEREGYTKYHLMVRDTGIGMSEEYIKELFEPFTREKTSTVSRIQGTGLGMSIVKNMVDLLGGTIQVKSEVGKGTQIDTFIELKIDSEGRTKTERKRRLKTSFEGKKLLIVEDNELNREIVTAILEEEGFIIETAEDGSVAVGLLKAKGPDYYNYILMDVQMPVMDGYEATRAIREMYPDSKIPIVALSANAFSEDKKRSKEAGMNGHVAKPIETQELLRVLAKL